MHNRHLNKSAVEDILGTIGKNMSIDQVLDNIKK